jgi:methyl-accepting chemotaxis protein IV, peptide sensor receptor
MSKAIAQIDQVTQQNAALVEEAASATTSMKDESVKLAQVVGGFVLASTAFHNALLRMLLNFKGQLARGVR